MSLRAARRTAILPLAVAVGGVVFGAAALTASNTIPATYAGTLSDAVTNAELAPTACAGLTLGSLTLMTAGSNTVTGPVGGGSLIIGHPPVSPARSTTTTGKQGSNCIVAGGGPGTTNQLTGAGAAKGDVCVGRTGATNVFTRCQYTTTIAP